VSEPPEKPKWEKEKVILFVAVMIFLMVVLPLLLILYVAHKFSQIH